MAWVFTSSRPPYIKSSDRDLESLPRKTPRSQSESSPKISSLSLIPGRLTSSNSMLPTDHHCLSHPQQTEIKEIISQSTPSMLPQPTPLKRSSSIASTTSTLSKTALNLIPRSSVSSIRAFSPSTNDSPYPIQPTHLDACTWLPRQRQQPRFLGRHPSTRSMAYRSMSLPPLLETQRMHSPGLSPSTSRSPSTSDADRAESIRSTTTQLASLRVMSRRCLGEAKRDRFYMDGPERPGWRKVAAEVQVREIFANPSHMEQKEFARGGVERLHAACAQLDGPGDRRPGSVTNLSVTPPYTLSGRREKGSSDTTLSIRGSRASLSSLMSADTDDGEEWFEKYDEYGEPIIESHGLGRMRVFDRRGRKNVKSTRGKNSANVSGIQGRVRIEKGVRRAARAILDKEARKTEKERLDGRLRAKTERLGQGLERRYEKARCWVGFRLQGVVI